MSGLRAIALVACLLPLLLLGKDSARASSSDLIEASYEIIISGIAVLKIKYSNDISATGYNSMVSIKTDGVATFFSDYRMEMSSSGSFVEGHARPARYASHAEKKDKKKDVEINWPAGSIPVRYGPAAKDPAVQSEIDAALTSSIVDPLTAILRVGASAIESPCQSVHRVFNGREIFDLRFSFRKEVTIDSESQGVYRGTAYECRMTVVPVAGRAAVKFRKNKTEPSTYRVWLAPVPSDALEGSVLVPVLAAGQLDGQEFLAIASRASIDGRPFNDLSQTGK
jgi:hypothetical protein